MWGSRKSSAATIQKARSATPRAAFQLQISDAAWPASDPTELSPQCGDNREPGRIFALTFFNRIAEPASRLELETYGLRNRFPRATGSTGLRTSRASGDR